MSIADEQWNEELFDFGLGGLTEYADTKQKTTKKTKTKATTPPKESSPKIKLQQERLKIKFNDTVLKFNELAEKFMPKPRITASMVIALRTLYKKADLIYKSLADKDKALSKIAASISTTMAEVSSRFTEGLDALGSKTKTDRKPAFVGIRNFLGTAKENLKTRVDEKKAQFAGSATGVAITKLASSIKGFTKKSTSFFSSMSRFARKPLDLLGGGGLFDLMGKAVGFAALGSMVIAPILSGIDDYLTKHFGTDEYIKKMIKDVWDSSWTKLKDEVRKFLGMDSATVNAAQADIDRRTHAVNSHGTQSFDSVADSKDYEEKVKAADANPTQANKASVEKAKVKMMSSTARDVNNQLSITLNNYKDAKDIERSESILTSPIRRWNARRAVVDNSIKAAQLYASLSESEITPENKVLYEAMIKDASEHGDKGAKDALQFGKDRQGILDKGMVATEQKSDSSTTMKPPVVQGGNVTVTADKEPMETSGGVTVEKPLPPEQNPQQRPVGVKTSSAGGAGLSAATIPTSAVGDNLVLLNSGVLS